MQDSSLFIKRGHRKWLIFQEDRLGYAYFSVQAFVIFQKISGSFTFFNIKT